jgi:hypothetical protein
MRLRDGLTVADGAHDASVKVSSSSIEFRRQLDVLLGMNNAGAIEGGENEQE